MVEVIAHQFLHGYRDGHRLVASSIAIPAELQREMLILSDISGPRASRGFDSYLTGYPVEALAGYAIARTWYADEMPRPGSVWTHTLVLPWRSLLDIAAAEVISAFTRPTVELGTSSYEHTVNLARAHLVKTGPAPLCPPEAQQILEAIYSEDMPVVTPAEESALYEHFAISLALQQPKALQRKFTFCTGALSPRLYLGQPFVLQVVPRDRISAFHRNANLQILHKRSTAQWSRRAFSDVTSDRHGIRYFLNLVVQSRDRRSAIRKYLAVETAWASCINNRSDCYRIHDVVATEFPDPSSGARLKQHLLLGEFAQTVNKNVALDTQMALLADILSREDAAASYEETVIDSAASRMWRTSKAGALELANLASPTDAPQVATRFARGVFAEINPIDLPEVVANHNFLPLAVRFKPSLFYQSEMWRERASSSLLSELLEYVRVTGNLDPIAVAVAQVEANNIELLARWLFELANRQFTTFIGFVFLPQLDDRIRSLVIGYVATEPTLFPTSIEPREIELIDAGTAANELLLPLWLTIQRNGAVDTEESHALFIAIALRSGGRAGQLLERSFSPIYKLAGADRLKQSSWNRIEPHVPSLGWMQDWDRCERLVRGVTDAFLRNGWTFLLFADAFKTVEEFKRAVKYLRKSDRGLAFLREGQQMISRGQINLRTSKRELLAKALKT